MKVAVIGASGNAGSCIVSELVRRGHSVTAIARHPEKIAAAPGVRAAAGDIHDADAMAALLRGHDAVVSSVRFKDGDPHKQIAAARASGVKRYLVVGGAGSLEVAPGVALIDTPQFPQAAMAEARAGIAFLNELRKADDLEWTFLSPSMMFVAGERTGAFRLGGDQLLKAADGSSRISFADYAIALVDEIERPAHTRRRFTVGY